jgi:hypothetical protein
MIFFRSEYILICVNYFEIAVHRQFIVLLRKLESFNNNKKEKKRNKGIPLNSIL